ncbi:MAG: prepilin-type N-terminal cleavage/methylation domain-containing protein [Lachnospiraceae bacterium]|nr:prepilin-type N-terminal cleavage/methylation domain-containing protein [Lachnospiraceae bacterium]
MWNTSNLKNKNNSGMTLVELLVAFAVSAIVLVGLSSIIFSVMQFYGRSNAHVEIQNESQTSLNLVIDSIISAKGVCFIEEDASAIDPATDHLSCALFGEILLDDTGTKAMTFRGEAIFWQPKYREMYLMSGTFDLGTYTDETQAPLEALTAMKGKLPALQEDRIPYLMAQDVTVFELRGMDECFVAPINKPEEEMTEEEKKQAGKHYFENPLIIHINIEFEDEYQTGRVITRQIDDNVSVRNRLDHIYVQRESEGMTKYLRNPN